MTRSLTKVAIGFIATYLILTLAAALFAPIDIHVAATASAPASTSTSVLLRSPQTFHKQAQAPLNSFSTITVPATSTPSAPAVKETTAVVTVTVTSYVQTPPLPTSITAFLEEYPYIATATLTGMTCFWIAVIWASLTFVVWCRIKIAMRADEKRNQEVKQKLKIMDLEKAPDELENMMLEEAEAELARNRHKSVSEMDLKQLIEELGRGT